ncbi:MAG: cytochrome c-type biogenesis protein CcmH, partial [Dehalococcoidales bacterium]|nr:cytochrome c-type biogenesis protein CcmH [Dehalococcoidales bacterium]
MQWKILGIVPLIIMALLVTPVSADSAPTVNSIAEQLVCQCGCNQTVAACPDSPCPSADPIKAMIGQKLAQGQSESQILQAFVGQYGEKVLVTPPKSGLNLVAWILPFVALLAGAAIIFSAMRAWVKRGSQTQITTTTESEQVDEEYRRRVEQELKEFEER